MFSAVHNRLESTLSYFGYRSKPPEGLPAEIHECLENQELSAESTLQSHRVASTPPSIWKRVASLGLSYLVFSSGQSSVQQIASRCTPWIPAVSFTTLSEPLTPIFIAGLSIFPNMVHAQSPRTTFFEVFGGANDDGVKAITIMPNGDLVVVGYTDSFGAGGRDVLLSKFSSNGTLLWANTLGGATNDEGLALTITPEGDLVVVGYTSSFGAGVRDVLLSKFSSNGTLLWANTLGGATNDEGLALTITPEGDLVVAGYTSSFGEGGWDVQLSKFSSSGTMLWDNIFGGVSSEVGRALTVTSEGDLIVAGYTSSFGAGGWDVQLSKFSSNGALLWSNTLGGASGDYSYALATTSEGDLIVVGETFSFGVGGKDVLLSKFSSNGTLLWANTLGGASNDEGWVLTVTPEGDLIVAGYTGSFGAGGSDVLLSKFSSNGTLLWANTLGGASYDLGYALTITHEGDLVVTGYTGSFGAGEEGLLLAKWNAQGVIENCSAWQSITPQVQSITPTVTDVTLNMITDVPPWAVQDAGSALNVTDITNLLNQTTVCNAQTSGNRTFTTSPQASLSNETPLPNSQGSMESVSVSSSLSMNRISPMMSNLVSRSSHSTLMQTNSVSNTDTSSIGASRISTQTTFEATSSSTPSPSRGGTIPSITTLVYEELYPIIVNGETIGTFYFTGGSGYLDSDNANTLNIELDGDIEDGETVTLFTVPAGEEFFGEVTVLDYDSGSQCYKAEGVFTTSEEEHSYQLIFEHRSTECSQHIAALKLSTIPVLGGGLL